MALLSHGGNPADQAARVMRAQWDQYIKTYTPTESRLIGSIGEDMTGRSTADALASTQRAGQVADRMQSRYGIADLEGAPTAGVRQRQGALAQAEAFNDTSLAQVDRNQNIRTGMVDVGQGILNQATGGLASAAGMQGQRDAAHSSAKQQYSQAKSAQRASTIGTIASIGAMIAF